MDAGVTISSSFLNLFISRRNNLESRFAVPATLYIVSHITTSVCPANLLDALGA
jgi:hypothetical protein